MAVTRRARFCGRCAQLDGVGRRDAHPTVFLRYRCRGRWFRSQLADELKVPVTAPDQLVWSVSGGHEPIVSSMHEYAVSTETGARLPVGSEKFLHEDEYEWRQEPTYPPDGGWHTFTPGTH